jgi:hypothetical protein
MPGLIGHTRRYQSGGTLKTLQIIGHLLQNSCQEQQYENVPFGRKHACVEYVDIHSKAECGAKKRCTVPEVELVALVAESDQAGPWICSQRKTV